MQNAMLRKELVVGVILLFVFTCVNPSIGNIIEKSKNNSIIDLNSKKTGQMIRSSQNPPALLDDGLVGYWCFDEGSGIIAHDYSGKGNDGIVYGPSWTTGISGSALSFDGTDDYVSVPNSASLKIFGPMTISAWVKTSSSSEQILSIKGSGWQYGISWYTTIGVTSSQDGKFRMVRYFESGSNVYLRLAKSDISITDGQWHHVVGVDDGENLKVFIDAVETGSTSVIGLTPYTSEIYPFVTGRFGQRNFCYLNGLYDELLIYNRALNYSEILNLYQNPGGGGNLPPIANPGGPYHAEPGEEIQFDGSNSYDPDGHITLFQWNFGDGSTATGVKPKHTYIIKGNYTVTLTVTDNFPTRTSSTASVFVPIWFAVAFVTEISATNDVDIQGISDTIWINTNPYQSKNIADNLIGASGGSFTINVKFYCYQQISHLYFYYSWNINDQTGRTVNDFQDWVDITGSGHYWQYSFNVHLPPNVGKYFFNLVFSVPIWGSWLPQRIPQSTLYVIWGNPKSDVSPPEERWLNIATQWADGATSESQVAEKLVDSEYSNPLNWIYSESEGFTQDWKVMIDSNDGDMSDCYGFAYVWSNLAHVLGLNSGWEDYHYGGFLTSTQPALDKNIDANARNLNNGNKRDRWFFGAHCVGVLLNKYYDPTFGMKGFSEKDAGAEYIYDSTIPIDAQGFVTFSKKPPSSEKKLVRSTNDVTPHQWPIVEYKNPSLRIIEEKQKLNTIKKSPLARNESDTGLDTDGNGLFNFLMTNFTLEVPQSGDYYINGILSVNNTFIASGGNNHDVGKDLSSLGILKYLYTGVNNITLFFNGKDIFDSKKNGPYNIILTIASDTNISRLEFISSFYNFTQFQGLLLQIINVSDYGDDDNGDGIYEFITMNLRVNAILAGLYHIETILYYQDETIESKHIDVYLNQGHSTITFKFDGKKVFQIRKNSIYNVTISLSDSVYSGYETFPTSLYSYKYFLKPKVYFTNSFSDFGTNNDNDSYYEYLTIISNVDVNISGNYTIVGWLQDNVTSAINHIHLNAGTNEVPLNFDGTTLHRNKINGTINLTRITIHDDQGMMVDGLTDAYMTFSYNITQFQPPTALFRDEYADYGEDTNNNSLYDYLTVRANISVFVPGNYSLFGELGSPNGSDIITWTDTVSYLVPGVQTMQIRFNGPTIYQSKVNSSLEILGLALFDENGTLMDTRGRVYTTGSYNYSMFEHSLQNRRPYPPLLSGSTNGINDVQYNYTFVTVDPEWDNISYWVDWGDGMDSGWLGPYTSGKSINASHSWNLMGIYEVRVKAKDIYGNESDWSDSLFVYIIESILPEIEDHTQENGFTGDMFIFNATVTDNVKVSSVWVEYWYGTGFHTNVTMNNVIDNYWEKSITIKNTLDVMHYIISANDTSNNWNNSGTKSVIISDNDNPIILNVFVEPSEQLVGGNVNISCVVTDNIQMDDVFLFIRYPDMIIENLSITQNKTGDTFYCNKTYMLNGNYTFHIWANDTSGNANTSLTYNFTILVNHPPNSPSNPIPANGAIDVTIDSFLSWTGGDPDNDIVTYDVYFGKINPPSKVVNNQSKNYYNPGGLQYDSTYFWQIVAWDKHGLSTKGQVWNFTTVIELHQMFFIGFINKINDSGEYITFKAVLLIYVDFDASKGGIFKSGEKLSVLKQDQLGFIRNRFIFGLFDATISSDVDSSTVHPNFNNRIKHFVIHRF